MALIDRLNARAHPLQAGLIWGALTWIAMVLFLLLNTRVLAFRLYGLMGLGLVPAGVALGYLMKWNFCLIESLGLNRAR